MVQAQERDIIIRVEGSSELGTIKVDPERMTQVLGNLVSNALRHTPPNGEIVLSAVCRGQQVILSVSDNGDGIDPQHLPRIFDRFYRGDESRQQNGESGLGLAIARSIVQAHGGTITVSSSPGMGTTFIITL